MVLSSNRLTGSILLKLVNLSKLLVLELDHNQLSGNIPPELGSLSKLMSLFLNYNQLSGSIPPELGNLSNLQILFLEYNKLSGSIPAKLGDLTSLLYLYLQNNHLSGVIPAELGNLSKLQYFDLSFNQLGGSMPRELGNLSNLLYLYLQDNKIKGSIPDELGNLHPVYLYLNDNQLSGSIPAQLGNESYALYLYNNRYTFDGMEKFVRAGPHATFTGYSPQANIPVHYLNSSSLSVSAGGHLGNNTYYWFMVGKTGNTQIKGDSVFHPSQNGRYYAAITNSVCTQLTLHTDTIEFNRAISIANASLASKQETGKKITVVYPVPVKDILHIQTDGNVSVFLLNQSGSILLTANINGSGTMNVSSIAEGLYYLKNNSNGEVRKIMIAR